MHIRFTALTAIAVAAALAPSASARVPVDTSIQLGAQRIAPEQVQPHTGSGQDLRSPDTRDAAAASQAGRTLPRKSSQAPGSARKLTDARDGFPWGTVGVAVGGAVGIALIGFRIAARSRRRSSTGRMPAAAR